MLDEKILKEFESVVGPGNIDDGEVEKDILKEFLRIHPFSIVFQ